HDIQLPALSVKRGERGSDIERDTVVLRTDGMHICPDFVEDRIARDPVGSDNYRIDYSFSHELGGHGIGDHRDINPVPGQFPCREAYPLEERACLARYDPDLFAGLYCGADHAERSAPR